MTELSNAFENILPKTVVTGLSGATSLYESRAERQKNPKKLKRHPKNPKKDLKRLLKRAANGFLF